MDFVAFVLLNAVYYIRPQEFVPAFYATPLYNVAFWICLVVCLPALLDVALIRSALGGPIGICVTTVGAFAVISNLAHGQVGDASNTALDMFRVVVYYAMLLATVKTPRRLKWFLASLTIDGFIMAGLGVGDYLGYFSVPNLSFTQETAVINGEMVLLRRLGSTGIFGDPNDFGLFIVGCILFGLCLVGDRSSTLLLRALWLLPVAVLFEALRLTYSRAGMLSLLIGLAIYAVGRYGRRVMIVIAIIAPVILGIGGRQLSFNLSEGTGQSRVILWDLFIGLFFHDPILGIGYGHALDYSSQVAHNSYFHAYAELGFFGGTAFLSAMILSVWTLMRAGGPRVTGLDPGLRHLWPFLLAAVICYAAGIFSLSRSYVLPTYTIFGLAAAFERISLVGSSRAPLGLNLKRLVLLATTGLTFVIVMHFVVKILVNY